MRYESVQSQECRRGCDRWWERKSFRLVNSKLRSEVNSQGIGLMISSTLIANGATVYIIGPKQADLDR